MPHYTADITEKYHEGDSRDIHLTVYQENVDGRRQNLKNATIEWYLKEDKLEDDTNALLTKTTTDDSIEIDDARNGEAIIYIEDGDTEGFLEDGTGTETEKKTFYHVTRITDDRGNRITVSHGEFTIHK